MKTVRNAGSPLYVQPLLKNTWQANKMLYFECKIINYQFMKMPNNLID